MNEPDRKEQTERNINPVPVHQAKAQLTYKDLLHVWRDFRPIIIGIILLWAVLSLGVFALFGKPDSAGVVGDTFGMVNALFSGLAFSFIIIAMVLQREEMRRQLVEMSLQREQLTLQREELRMSREVAADQGHTLAMQRFDNTYFKLIETLKTSASSVMYANKAGNQAFRQFQADLSLNVSGTLATKVFDGHLANARRELFVPYEFYYRQLAECVKWLTDYLPDSKLLVQYRDILVAQLSIPQLFSVMVNCATVDPAFGKKLIGINFFEKLGREGNWHKNFGNEEFANYLRDKLAL